MFIWNVIGGGFIAVHELMDTQTEGTREMVDPVAERIWTLGGIAGGLATQVVEMRSAEDEYPLGTSSGDGASRQLGQGVRENHPRAPGSHRADIRSRPDHEDLLLSQALRLEMNHWLIRAHISDTDGRLATEGTVSPLDAATAAVCALQPEAVLSENDD